MYALICLIFAVLLVSTTVVGIEFATGMRIFGASGRWFDRLFSTIWLIGIVSLGCWIAALPVALVPSEVWVARHSRSFVIAGTLLGPVCLNVAVFGWELLVFHKIEFGPLPRTFYVYSIVVACVTSIAYVFCMRVEQTRASLGAGTDNAKRRIFEPVRFAVEVCNKSKSKPEDRNCQ
jgi:hypothetical protein